MLSDIISLVPDEQAVMTLVKRFDKLLRKYARFLEYEDAYNDLLLFFIELLHKLKDNSGLQNDDAIVNYISKAIKNHYICLSKNSERIKTIVFSDMTPA